MILRAHVLSRLKHKGEPKGQPRVRRIVGVSLLRETLARLYLAAEAMEIDVRDIALDEFTDEDRRRWLALADDHLRRWVNGEGP